jgi:hypothetical protein
VTYEGGGAGGHQRLTTSDGHLVSSLFVFIGSRVFPGCLYYLWRAL